MYDHGNQGYRLFVYGSTHRTKAVRYTYRESEWNGKTDVLHLQLASESGKVIADESREDLQDHGQQWGDQGQVVCSTRAIGCRPIKAVVIVAVNIATKRGQVTEGETASFTHLNDVHERDGQYDVPDTHNGAHFRAVLQQFELERDDACAEWFSRRSVVARRDKVLPPLEGDEDKGEGYCPVQLEVERDLVVGLSRSPMQQPPAGVADVDGKHDAPNLAEEGQQVDDRLQHGEPQLVISLLHKPSTYRLVNKRNGQGDSH